MDARDLMIGDYVMYNKNIYIIEEISSKGWAHITDPNTKTRVPLTSDYIISMLEPIPFTAKILEKNGFSPCEMPNGEYEYISDSNLIQVARCKSEYCWYVSIEHVILCLKIKYVHELQHALRLCGIEKEIEL